VSEIEAAETIKTYFAGFNAHDNQIYIKTHHFPHIRINDEGRVSIMRDAAKFLPLEDVLAQLTQTEGWHHSTLDSMEVIHASEHKVHFKIQFSRYKADGTKYGVYNSLWILTKKDNSWGIQARSSYAP
jgi:hypothetical protein